MTNYFQKTRQLGVSIIMVAPLLVVYELGILAVGFQGLNGVDFLTQQLLRLGGAGFLLVNLAIIGAFSAALFWQKKNVGTDAAGYFVPIFLESAIYAGVMGSLILTLMQEVHLLGPSPHESSLLTRIVISAGAGLHEELVFRLLLMGAIVWAVGRVVGEKAEWLAFIVALLVSSVLFSVAHFSVEPWAWFPFWFRTFAGIFFGLLYAARGFAVAAYTHAFYDVYVLIFRG